MQDTNQCRKNAHYADKNRNISLMHTWTYSIRIAEKQAEKKSDILIKTKLN